MAATMPATVKAVSRANRTFTPESRETSTLPPVAYQRRPRVVYFSTNHRTIEIAIAMKTGSGMSRNRPCPRALNSAGRLKSVVPLVTMNASPVTEVRVANVATNADRFR